MNQTIFLSLSLEETVQFVNQSIVEGSWTGKLLDNYTIHTTANETCVVLVYEKHYSRAGNRLTLTVTLDNFTKRTRMHVVGGGGGEGLFQFDWGASKSFEHSILDALEQYKL